MLFRQRISITKQLIPIYNTTVHKNMIIIALNVTKLLALQDTNIPQGEKIQKINSDEMENFYKISNF